MALFDSRYITLYLKRMCWVIAVFALLFVIGRGVSPTDKIAILNSDATIYGESGNLYFIDEIPIITQAVKGSEVKVLALTEEFFYVQLPSGERGFILCNLVGNGKVRILADNIDVYRTDPEINKSKDLAIGELNKNDTIEVLDMRRYYKVRLKDNTVGYASIDNECIFLEGRKVPVIAEKFSSKFTLKQFENKIIGKSLEKIESKFSSAQNIRKTQDGLSAKFMYEIYDEGSDKSYSFVNVIFKNDVAVDYNFEGAETVPNWKFLKYFPLTSIFTGNKFSEIFIGKIQFYPNFLYNSIGSLVHTTGFWKVLSIIFGLIVGLTFVAVCLLMVAFLPYLAVFPITLFISYCPALPNRLARWLIILVCIIAYYIGLNILVLQSFAPWLFWTFGVVMILGGISLFRSMPGFLGWILVPLFLIDQRCKFCHRIYSYRLVDTQTLPGSFYHTDHYRKDYKYTSGNTRYYETYTERYYYSADNYRDRYECQYCDGYYEVDRSEPTLLRKEML